MKRIRKIIFQSLQKKHINTRILPMVLSALAACTTNNKGKASDSDETHETMFQVSTLQELLDGEYDGHISVAELLKHGDTGVGTFDKIDGEMIVADGIVYQAKHDGSVCVADDSLTVPFANITYFNSDSTISLTCVKNMDDMNEQITQALGMHGLNRIYAARIDFENCDSILVRSELPQKKPYRPLAEVMKHDQREFTYNNIGGTIIALYFPSTFEKQNSIGWHYHFISSDKSKGGHVMNFASSSTITIHIDITPNYSLKFGL